MINFKGHRFEKSFILICVRWYLAYSLSYRNIQEMMAERGISVDHTNIYRWIQKFAPKLEAVFRKKYKRPFGKSWRMHDTYIKAKGDWKYLYRAVDKEGDTIDLLLTARRDRKAALRFFKKAIGLHGRPEKVTIDKSGSNLAALESIQEKSGSTIEIRQIKYLNNIVEQDHRAIKGQFLKIVHVLPWDNEAADWYAEIRHKLINTGQPIGEFDMMIAAHALSAGAVLVTNNTRHFERIEAPLMLTNWVNQ